MMYDIPEVLRWEGIGWTDYRGADGATCVCNDREIFNAFLKARLSKITEQLGEKFLIVRLEEHI